MKWTLVYFDDQIQNIECYRELLSEQFNVIGCYDGTAFPAILQANNPHAILLDVHMPVLDGHSLYKKIIEHPLYNGCPVIFISGDQSDENKLKSYAEGGIDFLPRDLNPEEVIVRLSNKIKYYLSRVNHFELGTLKVDMEMMRATLNDKQVEITLFELRVLNSILRPYPESITRAELVMKVWGNDSVKLGTINTHLSNLKNKLRHWDYEIKIRDENILIKKITQ